MRLIDKETVIDAIEATDWYHIANGELVQGASDEHTALYKAEDVLREIERIKAVEAIPIEWINHYMDTRLTKGTLFYSCMSEFMRDWQKEQEKQNEK